MSAFQSLLLPLLIMTGAANSAVWKQIWAEEFNTPGLPDPAKWKYEQGFIRNKEAQYYTRARAENARVEGGHLIIEARKENFQTANYTSASINTLGLASWTYGRIEVRAKIPGGRGSWPAIWAMGTDTSNGTWPNNGEIDIMENVGFDPNRIHGTVHTGLYNWAAEQPKGGSILIFSPSDFHVYAVEWTQDRIDWYVDTTLYFTFRNNGTGWEAWPYNKPQYLLLNLAIGGGWGGQKGIDDSIFPQKFLVDYVRVFTDAGATALQPRAWNGPKSGELPFHGVFTIDAAGRNLSRGAPAYIAPGVMFPAQ